jgi:hypothetical protein
LQVDSLGGVRRLENLRILEDGAAIGTFDGRRGSITLGYRGTFAFGRDGLADVKFRKLSRVLVCGRVALCREVPKYPRLPSHTYIYRLNIQ